MHVNIGGYGHGSRIPAGLFLDVSDDLKMSIMQDLRDCHFISFTKLFHGGPIWIQHVYWVATKRTRKDMQGQEHEI